MRTMMGAIGIAMAHAAAVASGAVEMSIVTNKGYVAFAVGDEWSVLSMQSKLPIASAAFQLPNPGDQGTTESTNLVITLHDSGSKQARAAFDAPVKQEGSGVPEAGRYGEWTVWRQQAPQGDITYTILDAKREAVADVLVKVRLAWPHLPSNAPGYDAEMEATFRTFLSSVRGGMGKYKAPAGSTTRRPEP